MFICATSCLSTHLLMDTAHTCLAGGLPLLPQPDKNRALTKIWTCSWSLRWAVYNGVWRQAWNQLEPRFLPLFPRHHFSSYNLSSLLPFELWFPLLLFSSRLLEIKDGFTYHCPSPSMFLHLSTRKTIWSPRWGSCHPLYHSSYEYDPKRRSRVSSFPLYP